MADRLADVDPMVQQVMSHLEGVADADLLPRVQICLSEALTNLVVHAQTDVTSNSIEISLVASDGTVGLDIFDPDGARPFDLRAHAQDLSDIDPLAEGGRGLGLIVEFADSVEYGPERGRYRLALGFNGRGNAPE